MSRRETGQVVEQAEARKISEAYTRAQAEVQAYVRAANEERLAREQQPTKQRDEVEAEKPLGEVTAERPPPPPQSQAGEPEVSSPRSVAVADGSHASAEGGTTGVAAAEQRSSRRAKSAEQPRQYGRRHSGNASIANLRALQHSEEPATVAWLPSRPTSGKRSAWRS